MSLALNWLCVLISTEPLLSFPLTELEQTYPAVAHISLQAPQLLGMLHQCVQCAGTHTQCKMLFSKEQMLLLKAEV